MATEQQWREAVESLAERHRREGEFHRGQALRWHEAEDRALAEAYLSTADELQAIVKRLDPVGGQATTEEARGE